MKATWLGMGIATLTWFSAGGCGGDESSEQKPVGSACTAAAQCEDGACLTEAHTGFPGGYCSASCNQSRACPAGSSCANIGQSEFFCLADCTPGEHGACRTAQQCAPVAANAGVCNAGCTSDNQCAVLGKCDPSGICVAAED